MSFNPDSRNVGGRKEIMDILNNHHLTLLNIKSTMKTRASYLKFKKPLHSMSNVHKKKKSCNFLYLFCLFDSDYDDDFKQVRATFNAVNKIKGGI